MNILTVDDDAVIRATLCEILRRERSWNVVDADNGEVAWQMLENGLDVDMCIFDNVMPELMGIDLVKRMREDSRFQSMPIILVTMNRDRELVMDAVKCNVRDFILKPFKASRLVEQVRAVADTIPKKQLVATEVLTDPEIVISRLEIDYPRYLKILDLFLTDLGKGIIDTRNLLTDGDILPALSRLDAMKGSCLTFGAYKFRNTVEKINDVSLNSLTPLETALEELREVYHEIKSDIENQGLTTDVQDSDSSSVPLGEGVKSNARAKVLLIEDKPIIVRQIKENLISNSWIVKDLQSPKEAMEYAVQNKTDLIVVSLSLQDNGAFSLIRFLRSNARTRGVPVFGLSIKTAVEEQRKAQESGFNAIVTKPIDFAELKNNVTRTLQIDTTSRFYNRDGEFFIINVPGSDLKRINELSKKLPSALAEAVESGYGKVLIDAQQIIGFDMDTFEFLGEAIEACNNLAVPHALVGSEQVSHSCKEFEDYQSWVVYESLEQAKMSFADANQPAVISQI